MFSKCLHIAAPNGLANPGNRVINCGPISNKERTGFVHGRETKKRVCKNERMGLQKLSAWYTPYLGDPFFMCIKPHFSTVDRLKIHQNNELRSLPSMILSPTVLGFVFIHVIIIHVTIKNGKVELDTLCRSIVSSCCYMATTDTESCHSSHKPTLDATW